ncbi:NADPH-dependent FMN reductase [Pseudomonas sp. HK3]|jgi:NAD(P)H-dependent FMN reductase
MNICIISASTREQSASINVAQYVNKQLGTLASDSEITLLDLHKANIPLWQEGATPDSAIEQQLQQADGFVFIVPEWHGMAPPAFKNIFFYFNGCFAHKPVYIVSVSAGTGGRYPISELRMSSYKNSFINYIPVSTIVDHVNDTINENGEFIAQSNFIAQRIDEGLQFLLAYTQALYGVRDSNIFKEKRFKNGL